MDLTLQALLDELGSEDGNLAEFLQNATATAADLSALQNEAVENFEGLYNRGTDISADDYAAMQQLAAVAKGIKAELATREAAAAEQRAELDELAADIRPNASDDPSGDDANENEGEGDDNADEGEGEGGQEVDGLEVDIPDDASELAEPVTAASGRPGKAVVAATRRKINMRNVSNRVVRPAPPNEDRGSKLAQVMIAAADVPGVPSGHAYADWSEVARAAMRRFQGMTKPASATAGKSLSYGIAQIHKPRVEELQLERFGGELNKLVDAAADEKRLSGQSLVAAGGWCGPADRWLDFCDLNDSLDGLFDLPEVTLTRGRVEYYQGPDYCAMWDMVNDGFFGPYTSANADASVEKACVEIPCPSTPLTCEQVAYGLCITAGILTQRSWPEWIERFIQFALRAHTRRMSSVKLNAVVAGSANLGTVDLGIGATSSILNAIDLEVEWIKYRNRMARNASVELIAPYWIMSAIKADLANREGIENFSVTDAQIMAWFAARNVRPQFVYDWQPLAGCGVASPNGVPGVTTPITEYPATVEFVLYPAGTWVAAAQDIITMDALYSPELLRINRYQALFTEEALCVINRCPGSYRFTVPVCPSGGIGQREYVTCNTPEPVEP